MFNDGPPEKEHPLTTIGACLAIALIGYFLIRGGIGLLVFAMAILEEEIERPRMRGYSPVWFLMGGTLVAVGLTFIVGALWWTWKAVKAWRRGEMVE